MKNIPQRTCIVCRTQKNKNELLRIVKNIIKVDESGKEHGRGAYICYNMDCFERAKKSKKLERTLEIKINDDTYEQIKNAIESKMGGDVIG